MMNQYQKKSYCLHHESSDVHDETIGGATVGDDDFDCDETVVGVSFALGSLVSRELQDVVAL